MKKTISLFAMACFIAFGAMSQQPNTLTPDELQEGWELLFDGETLRGWKGYNTDVPLSWEVRDGAMFCTGESGGVDIMTVGVYGDFDLMFDWKIEKNGNSGVIWRAREGKQWSAPYLTGPEYQVFDDPGQFGKQSTASCYDVYEPSTDKKLNPAMSWNSGRIRVSQGQVTYWLNGVITVSYELHSADWKERVANSKWRDNPYYGMSPFGHIDFQNHGNQVWYQNIKIRRLD